MKISDISLISVQKNTLVMSFIPTYKIIEISESDGENYVKPLEVLPLSKAIAKYGDRKLLSVADFHDIKATSYIVETKTYKA